MTQHRLPALLREPILHFVLLGVLAYVAYAALEPAATKTIVTRPEILDGLEERRDIHRDASVFLPQLGPAREE